MALKIVKVDCLKSTPVRISHNLTATGSKRWMIRKEFLVRLLTVPYLQKSGSVKSDITSD